VNDLKSDVKAYICDFKESGVLPENFSLSATKMILVATADE
jgi:hypothetical protein